MTTVLTLYAVTDQLRAIGEQLLENGGELTPELEQQLAQVEGAFEDKVERILLYGQNLEVSGAAAAQEAARLSALAQQRANAARRLKDYVKTEMERAGRDKVETDRIVARIQKNGRASIAWTRPIEDLPEHFVRVRRELNADAAYAAWKAGEPLPPGFDVKQGTHLRVK